MKILLVAYNCEPGKGSEDGIGWSIIKSLSKIHEVIVLTRLEFKEKLEDEKLNEQGHNVRYHFLNTIIARTSPFYNWLTQIIYYVWQLRAAVHVRKLTRNESFDIIQHVTWIRCWMPSAIMGAVSGKIVWGPVGGVEYVPEVFLKTWCGSAGGEYLKRVLIKFSRLDPFVRYLARKTDLGIACTPDALTYLKEIGCRNVLLMDCVGLSAEDMSPCSKHVQREREGIRFISIGRLLGWKGYHYGLKAFATAAIPSSEYWIIGDGKIRNELEHLCRELGILDSVRFLGNIPRNEVLYHISESDILVHPSFRDSGGWVCLEAMGNGLPVICLDKGGPAVMVTEDTGMRIRTNDVDQVIHDISSAMVFYSKHKAELLKQGKNGIQRVKHCFSWDHKADLLTEYYNELRKTDF